MILLKTGVDLESCLSRIKAEGKRVGFVPTMGALHEGHVSLIESSRKDNSITVCSIFVNPTQFNDPADFKKYPITIEDDIYKLGSAGCDILFLPGVKEMYPDGPRLNQKYELGFMETILEGQHRPGHFQGVCTIVHRLLDIVQPHSLYLGQKDYQQCMVIRRLMELTSHSKINLVVCPTVREADGLAMSSRNRRLKPEERRIAPTIYQTLLHIKQNLVEGDVFSLEVAGLANLKGHGFKPDYLEIADATSLQLIDQWDGKQKLVALTAAFLNEVRLIDNMLLN